MLVGISGYAGSGKDTAGEALRYLFARHRIHPDLKFSRGVEYTESGWDIKKFADPLRKVAAILTGLPVKYLYTDEFKRSEMSSAWTREFQTFENDEHNRDGFDKRPMTGREFLQFLGTDAIRDNLHENAWVNALMSSYRPADADDDGYYTQHTGVGTVRFQADPIWDIERFPNWIITDMRFPNELEAVKSRGGITVRVKREKAVPRARQLHESETALDGAQFDFTIDNNGSLEDLVAALIPVTQKLSYEQKQIHPA